MSRPPHAAVRGLQTAGGDGSRGASLIFRTRSVLEADLETHLNVSAYCVKAGVPLFFPGRNFIYARPVRRSGG